MGQRIDEFCERLRVKLTNADNNIDRLKTKIDTKVQGAEQDVKNHLDGLKKRAEQERAKIAAAQTEIKNWANEQKTITAEKVAEWKAKREVAKLQQRADAAERYAAAAVVVAVAAVDEAEQASLEAWLARHDADNVQKK